MNVIIIVVVFFSLFSPTFYLLLFFLVFSYLFLFPANIYQQFQILSQNNRAWDTTDRCWARFFTQLFWNKALQPLASGSCCSSSSAFIRDFSLCSLHVHTPSCSTPVPPKFLPLCTSCNSSPGLERSRAEPKLCRFGILGCLWVRWTSLFLFVCVLGLMGFFLVSCGVFWGRVCLFFCFICSFPNVFLMLSQRHRSEMQLYSFLFCGEREQNGSSQDAAFLSPVVQTAAWFHMICWISVQRPWSPTHAASPCSSACTH